MSDQEMKQALKEALKEWLDERFALFGRFSMAAVASLGLAALMYFVLSMNGWHR